MDRYKKRQKVLFSFYDYSIKWFSKISENIATIQGKVRISAEEKHK